MTAYQAEVEARKILSDYIAVSGQQFTESEQTCISGKISEFREEGIKEAQAVAKAVSICAPEKARSESSQAVRDPAAVCGEIWFNGTDEQREAFKGGTQGRGRDEKPPEAWFDD